jgi:NAD(P)-dependent dehydrogenase (short-subunit alcohol dehydrogenase family)
VSAAAGLFDLTGRVAVITGGAGLLGMKHAEAVASAGGIPVLLDVRGVDAAARASELGIGAGIEADITSEASVEAALATVRERFGRVDILINNAANNPKVEEGAAHEWSRLETFPLDAWNADIAVGLTGAFLCSRVFGSELARRGGGVILNIASDLAVIAPDQRIYRQPNVADDRQPVKPVSYPVVKSALLGLTRYLATYWADANVRVNALSPGGVRTSQDPAFVELVASRIPLGRMAEADEYKGAVLFLVSDASSYMTGANLVVDGGRTAW